jgi:DNA polymerase family A
MVKQFNKEGIPVTSVNVEELAKYDDPLIEQYQEYKTIKHLITSFSSKLPAYRAKSTGRVHANFFQYGTKSGRFSCKYPNLQQQPSKFKKWRTIFTAEPSHKIIAFDYSQIELSRLSQNSSGLYIWVINIGIFIFFKDIYYIKSIFLKKINSGVSHVQKVRSKAAIFTSIESGRVCF